jgi:nucleoside transporter
MKLQMKFRLGAMMFLEYFIWGAWYVTLGTWLSQGLTFSGRQVGLAAGATAVGAIIAPFCVGLIADKLFATQWVLAALHGMGAVLLFAMSLQTRFGSLYLLDLLYCLAFMPTLALTNALAFRQMRDAKIEFGPIRVLGTAGWITAGLLVGTLAWEKTRYPAQLAAAASLLMAVYCLSLPATPPLARDARVSLATIFPPETFALLRERSMAIFAIASFLICIPLQFYYAFTNLFLNEAGVSNAAGKMTGGQFSELFCMLLIPWFFRRLGVKYMLVAGMAAWTLRYLLFAFGDAGDRVWMLWGGILLHGICYDFFFVTGQIYIDRKAPIALRGATQGLITFITYGVGMFVGSWLSGAVVQHYSALHGITLTHNWQAIWIVSAAASALVLVVFLLTFHDAEQEQGRAEAAGLTLPVELPL